MGHNATGWPTLERPASTPIPYIWDKLDRAYKHVEELEPIVAAIVEDPNRKLVNPEPEAFQAFKAANVEIPVDLRISVIAGEIFYQLRSVLDHLVCRFIEFENGMPGKKSMFPIFEADPTKDPNLAGLYRQNVKGISRPEVLAFIDSKQPYHRGDLAAAQTHYLSRLNWKCNLDKHTAMDVQVMRAQRSDVMMGGLFTIHSIGPYDRADPPLDILFNDQPVKVDARFGVYVAFKEWSKYPEFRGEIISTLYEMIRLIAADVTEGQAHL